MTVGIVGHPVILFGNAATLEISSPIQGDTMTVDDGLKPPKRTVGDIASVVVKAGLSMVPLVGGPAAELFAAVITPPLEKRREKWMNEIAEGLRDLAARGDLDIESLSQNPLFLTTVLQASQAALRNHQEEKLVALRNAVLNAAMPNPLDESINMIFLNFIDTCTVWHLKILDLFDDPARWAERHQRKFPVFSMGGLENILENLFPELSEKEPFYNLIWRDLVSKGLLEGDLHVTMSDHGLRQPRSTEMGKMFLRFVADPRRPPGGG